MKHEKVLFYQEGTCALAPLIAMLWVDRPFKLCRLEDGDNENPDYLKLNGLGEVPTLFLEGTILTENIAILQHIAQEDLSSGLTFEVHTREFDQLNRALGFLTSTFHKAFLPLFAPQMFHPDEKIQEEIQKYWIDGPLREVFAYTSEHLLRSTLLFDFPTIGDFYLFAMARWGQHFGKIDEQFPEIVRFQKRMNEYEPVKLALRIETGEVKGPVGNFLGHVDFRTYVQEAAARKRQVDGARGEGEFTPGLAVEAPTLQGRSAVNPRAKQK